MSGISTGRGQEKFIVPLSDYTEEQSTDKLEYVTGQNTNGQKRAIDAVIYGTYAVSTLNTVGAGSTKRKIKKVAHGARKNDIVQFTSGLSSGVTIQVLSCPDVDTLILAATSEFAITIGDTFDVKRYVSPQYDSTGSLNVVASQGPTKFVLNTVETMVNEDTANPSNNRELPVKEIKPMSETLAILDCAGLGIDNVAWTDLIAVTTNEIKSMTWFESTGVPMEIAVGAAGLEIRKFVTPPGGFNGNIPMDIPAGSRVSIRALTNDVIQAGTLIIANFYR